jgi:dethiobiotin synthetase
MKKYFITATGTGVGKTLITSALTWQLRQHGKRVTTLKPVISGFDMAEAEQTDTGLLLQAQEMPITVDNINAISPWRFAAPLSPDMAAQDAGAALDFSKLETFCKEPRDADVLLIEGVGGVMTTLNGSHSVLDWMEALEMPIILVAGSYLGAISHTLTAYEAIASRGLHLHALIISESEESSAPFSRLRATLQNFLPAELAIHHVTRVDSSQNLWKDVPDLTSVIT